ncbi:hypothetical protein HUF15_00670 [Streptomyces samsunensis]|uniref:hypothetical protein n=1 Tax=Streptomyces malaysiensis TaxID=92644 RepID=UPI0015833BB7|nr:hypothetical protein [Streptomyces samsunensis]NUH35294.1 hypothetical protein [Streptomyces samsunensis]
MARRNDDLFDTHASPGAVQIELRKARAEARRAARRVAWLEELLERRTAEREAGTWPAPAEDGDSR